MVRRHHTKTFHKNAELIVWHYGISNPEKYHQFKPKIRRSGGGNKKAPTWTDEEVVALAEGVDVYGISYDRILKEYAVLEHRTANSLEIKYR